MTRLPSQIIGQMRELRMPMTVHDISHQLGAEPADVLIALHDLIRAGRVRSKLRGVRQRIYYELV